MQCLSGRIKIFQRQLSHAQHGRAASQAISFALHQANIADACHIVNTIRLSDDDVSPRLPSHILLHGLIRRRLPLQASHLAEQMMSAGIKVRTRSLEALFSALPPPSSPTHSPNSVLRTNAISHSLNIHPELISDSSTRFAVRLLLLARKNRQRRTHRMFKTLMALCFINGEIILASLLFGILVRDWQNRVQLGQLNQDLVDSQVDAGRVPPRSMAIYDTPFPAWSHLNHICGYIDHSFATSSEHSASLQALANLAQLLDHRLLPIGSLSGLLQSMYNCPPAHHNVWASERLNKKKPPDQVEVHAYFRRVLERLAFRLPKAIPNSQREVAPAPLTLQTYNTLLHYSLVHARSRRMADKILHHMLYVHQGIQPSPVTINILQSAAMRSRNKADNGINRQWVEAWKKRVSESANKGAKVVDEIASSVSELLDIAKRYDQNDPDNYTLSTRIIYLIACGKPEVVVNALPVLLPGISSHSTWRHNPIVPSKQLDSAIRRAVAYGPVVLTSILTALMKSGRTGLAERMWEIMKRAEQLSWERKGGVLSPWCLGIEAYTVMIRVYGKEARKGAGFSHDHTRIDRGVDREKCMVVGWGRQERWNKRRGGRRRRAYLGRCMGMKIYREALKEEAITRLKLNELCSQMENEDSLRIRVVKNQLRLPQPDAHFFNAIIDIVARRPGMVPRSRASWTRRKGRSRLMVKRRKYLREGKVLGLVEPDGRLREVARDIRRYGFEVPLLVRRLLVGRDEGVEGVESGGEGRVWLKVDR